MKIVCISDTHSNFPEVPDGDVLIHAGDFTKYGHYGEIKRFNDWFCKLPHKTKLVIAGNHELTLDQTLNDFSDGCRAAVSGNNYFYLKDMSFYSGGHSYYGSPYQPSFGTWAFNIERRSKQLEEKWSDIPDDVVILITHCPPFGILDRDRLGVPAGCELLAKRIKQLKNLKLHVFGHLHAGYGTVIKDDVQYVNASICDDWNNPVNDPIVVEI